MPDARRQFRILYRSFLFRMVDLEVLSAHGDMQKLLVQLTALLSAFSLVLATLFVLRYAPATVSHRVLLIAAWGDEEFLIATTIGVVGMFAVMSWNVLLPDRRDSLVLGPLPVRTSTIFGAKVVATGTVLGLAVAAVNIFTGLSYPFFIVSSRDATGGIRAICAFWVTMFAAGLFAFCALLAVQGIAAQVLSYRLFPRVSSFLQLGSLFLILGVYFLTPPLANVRGLTSVANQRWLAWLPSFWFLGLFQQLNGSTHPVFGPLAERALWSLLLAFTAAAASYTLAYQSYIRRVVEQPDIAPSDRSRPAAPVGRFLIGKLLRVPVERAILLFTARTIARSRQHRLLLASYGGVGLAIALAYTKSLFYGRASEVGAFGEIQYGDGYAHWYTPSVPLLIASLVPLCFAVTGARAVFALPLALPANWIFRITAVQGPAAYFAGVRKSLYALTAVPIWMLAAVLYFYLWPVRPAAGHLIVLAAIAVFLVERSLYQFRKLPFACSYLPGKANLNVKLGAYGILFLLAADFGVRIELLALQSARGFAILCGILFAAAVWVRRRTSEFAASPYHRVQFEDLSLDDPLALDLRRDGAWSGDQAYSDKPDERGAHPQSIRRLSIGP